MQLSPVVEIHGKHSQLFSFIGNQPTNKRLSKFFRSFNLRYGAFRRTKMGRCDFQKLFVLWFTKAFILQVFLTLQYLGHALNFADSIFFVRLFSGFAIWKRYWRTKQR